MSSRNSLAFVLAPCLLAAALLGFAPVAHAASVGQVFLKPIGSAENDVVLIGRRSRKPWHRAPIVPYIAYDYPYYYSRGFYPTHIGPGYVHYGQRYPYGRLYNMRTGARCSHWRRSCAPDWRYRQSRGRRMAGR